MSSKTGTNGSLLPILIIVAISLMTIGGCDSDQERVAIAAEKAALEQSWKEMDAERVRRALDQTRDIPDSILEKSPASAPEQIEEAQPPPNPVRLRNGARILRDRYPDGLGELRVHNGTDRDAAVKLVRYGSKKAYRYYFARKGEVITIPRISRGAYEVYIRSGLDWDKKMRRFCFDERLATCTGEESVFEFVEEEEEGGVRYSKWSLTLHPVAGGKVKQRDVSSEEFGDDE